MELSDRVSGPKSRFAFVVAASNDYTQGLKAMFNSMDYHGMTEDVILIPWNISPEFLAGLGRYKFQFRLEPNDVDHQVLGTAIERFRVAYELGQEYDAICLLDADMFFHNKVDLFFDIASRGFIVTASNGMVINFNREYQNIYGVDLGSDQWPYPKVHTTAPIFLSPKDLDWFKALYDARRIDHWDDFLYLNILGIKMEKYKRMLCLAPYAWTGIHHWQLKIETSIISKGRDLVFTGTEEEIYMSHGKFWDELYNSDLLKTMDKYRERWDMGEKCKERVLEAYTVLLEQYNKYLNHQPS